MFDKNKLHRGNRFTLNGFDTVYTIVNIFPEGLRATLPDGQGIYRTWAELDQQDAALHAIQFIFAQQVLADGRNGIVAGLTPTTVYVMFRDDSDSGEDYFNGSIEQFNLADETVEPMPF